ncbi:MAG: hypothetical protein ACLQLG_17600 [Thermoguttaceae bacterium]
MSTTSPQPDSVRRLTDIRDAAQRENATKGVQVTLEAHLAHLRSIKDTEHKWLELYAVLVLPAIGYLMSVDATNPIFNWPLVVMLVMYLGVSVWLQYVLLRERVSYYAVLRSVIRSQNLLGLFDIRYLSEHFANSAFPKGFGPNTAVNGTQPWSSFLRRLLYVVLLLAALFLAAGFRWWSISRGFVVVPVLCFLFEVAVIFCVFHLDSCGLREATAREANLAGCEERWFPK